MSTNQITQAELDALIEAAQPEPWVRQREREEAQLRLGRLWSARVLKWDSKFNYVLTASCDSGSRPEGEDAERLSGEATAERPEGHRP